MSDTKHDTTIPAKSPAKPGDTSVATPATPADHHAAGALGKLQHDVHPALAAKSTDVTAVKPPRSEAESLADKLHDDLGWAFKKVSSAVSTVASDAFGVPKDAAAAVPKDAAAAVPKDVAAAVPKDVAVAVPKVVAAAVPKDVAAAVPNATGTAPKETAGSSPKDIPKPPLIPSAAIASHAAPDAAAPVEAAQPAAAPTDASSSSNSGLFDYFSDATQSLYSQLTSAAVGAEKTFESTFGTGTAALQNFAETAEKVADVSQIDFDPAVLCVPGMFNNWR